MEISKLEQLTNLSKHYRAYLYDFDGTLLFEDGGAGTIAAEATGMKWLRVDQL